MRTIYTVLLLIGILCIVFLLGSRMILAGDFLYLSDQGRDMLLVKDIALNHTLTLIGTHSGLGGFFHGPIWLYMLVPVFYLGQGNPMAFAFFYIILALVVVLSGFLIGKLLYNSSFGLLTAFFLAINPRIYGYVISTQGVNVLPLVYLGMFFGFIQFLRGNKKGFIIAVFFIGLSLQFETASSLLLIVLTPILFILSILLIHTFQKGSYLKLVGNDFSKNIKTHLHTIFLSIISFCIAISTFILFDLRHQFLMSKSFFLYIGGGEKSSQYLVFPQRLLQHMQSFFDVYRTVVFDQENLLLQIFLIFIVGYAWILLLKTKNADQQKREFLFYLFFPILLFFLFFLYPDPIYPEYMIGVTIPAIFLLVLAIQTVWQKGVGKIVIGIFFSYIMILVVHTITSQYLTPYAQNQTAGSYKNQQRVINWIFQDAKGKPFGYFMYTPETFTYSTDYLFWWKGKTAYDYIPLSQKRKQTYLILAPPLQNDVHAHEFWKKYVIHVGGKINKRKIFPGGVIVEEYTPSNNESVEEAHYHQNLIFR